MGRPIEKRLIEVNCKKRLVAACFVSAILIFAACGAAPKQGGQNEPRQAGDLHTQIPADRVTTMAATATTPPVRTTAARPSQATAARTAPPTTTTKPAQSKTADEIGLEKAKAIALGHAGVKAAQARFKKEKIERDDGVTKYHIEFAAEGFEYDYIIHAGTGVILDAERKRAEEERHDRSQPTQQGEIGMEKAKAIALADTGVTAAQARFKKEKRERDDGITIYELEFVAAGYEYKYKIHAGTGVILKRDKDRD